tara:strand:- start:240 stop:2528 length:2289 start_codon:yes stop_codon:yes gene_type:complete
MTKKIILKEQFVGFLFLILFTCLGFYLLFIVANSPIGHQFNYNNLVRPLLSLSNSEILLSDYHFHINVYRNIISNNLFNIFGFNKITFRFFPVSVFLLTIIVVYRFTSREIGRLEAILSALLFFISYHILYNIALPRYTVFFVFASFLTFFFLCKGFEENKVRNWVAFAIINFLNLTNTFTGFLFLPAVVILAAVCVMQKIQGYGAFTPDLRKRLKHFMIFFSASLIMVMVLYYFRGINMVQIAFEIITYGKIENSELIASLGDRDLTSEKSKYLLGFILFRGLFLLLNFNIVGGIAGGPVGHWTYFIFFLIGLSGLYIQQKKIFWRFFPIFFIPVVVCPLFFNMAVPRYVVFVLPFYLITVAAGFVFLFSFVAKFVRSEFLKSGSILLSAFLIFTWLIQPKPIWSLKYLDKVLGVRGYTAISDYLSEHIKPSDIIMNVTRSTELRGQIGDALMMSNYALSLDRFYEHHRLDLLPLRKGKIGVWLILAKPLEEKGLLPFYFPKKYSPQFVFSVHNNFLYYGTLDLPDSYEIEKDNVFISPFWLFMKARSLQLHGENTLAKVYYQKVIKSGFNVDRAYFNLGLMYSENFPLVKFGGEIETAINYFQKAVKIIETPTKVPEKAKMGEYSYQTETKQGMLAFGENRRAPWRFYTIEKNGIQFKKWFIEDFAFRCCYVNYYLAPAIIFFNKYTETGKMLFFEEAKKYFIKTKYLVIKSEKHSYNQEWIGKINFLLKNKPLKYPLLGKFQSVDLRGIQDMFPALIAE